MSIKQGIIGVRRLVQPLGLYLLSGEQARQFEPAFKLGKRRTCTA